MLNVSRNRESPHHKIDLLPQSILIYSEILLAGLDAKDGLGSLKSLQKLDKIIPKFSIANQNVINLMTQASHW